MATWSTGRSGVSASSSSSSSSSDGDGWLRADSVDAAFLSNHDVCDGIENRWNGGDDDARRDGVGNTRNIQVSSWRWNTGATDVVLYDVHLAGATSLVEEGASGDRDAR